VREASGKMRKCRKDGIIKLDSELGRELGFTSDKFEGWLWKNGNDIWISFIESKHKGRGDLSRLFETILEKGYTIKVPTPVDKMKLILIKKGFKKTTEFDERTGKLVEVWVKRK